MKSRHTSSRAAAALVLALGAGGACAQSALYSHDFETTAGWPDSDVTGDIDAIYTTVAGEYLINPLRSMHYALALAPVRADDADVAIETDLRLAAGDQRARAGIACRADGTRFYAFNLIASGGWEIVKVSGGDQRVLASGRVGFDPSGGARLRAECRGANLAFFADGAKLGETADAAFNGAGGAGLVSVAPVTASTNAAFDNFRLMSYGGGPRTSHNSLPARAQPQLVPPPRAGTTLASSGVPRINDLAIFDNEFGKPGQRKTLFDEATQRIFVVMELANSRGAHFRAEWKNITGGDERLLSTSNYTNDSGNPRVWLYADRFWDAGLYRVDVYANDMLMDQREFSVY